MTVEVRFFDDAIGIYDGDEELVYWTEQEWKEDSDVVFSIANAIHLAHTDYDEFIAILGEIVG